MIKIYAKKEFLNEKNRKRIFPLLFELFFLKNENLLQHYQIVDSIEESDLVLIPVDITYFFKQRIEKKLYEIIDEAKKENKIVWAYSGGDVGKSIKANNLHTFRLGGFDSKLDKNTFILPCFVLEPYRFILKREFTPIPKSDKPQLGFVGHANGSIKGILHEFFVFLFLIKERILKNFYIDYQPFYPSGFYRFRFLDRIKKDKSIVSNFVLRDNYTGGSQHKGLVTDTTLEFFFNMFENPYVFCLRGVGNFSVRFYEALAMGRIPVVINSDFRLPFNNQVNWEDHCVFVDKNTFVKDLSDFHSSISDEDFIAMQIKNRELFQNKLTIEGYFIELHNQFKK